MKKKTVIENFLNEIYILKHIIRYNTVPKISHESVAEHSFFVTAIVLELHKYYDFDLEKALTMAVVHDFCETHISDVPRNVKNKYARLRVVTGGNDEGLSEDYRQYDPDYSDEAVLRRVGERICAWAETAPEDAPPPLDPVRAPHPPPPGGSGRRRSPLRATESEDDDDDDDEVGEGDA